MEAPRANPLESKSKLCHINQKKIAPLSKFRHEEFSTEKKTKTISNEISTILKFLPLFWIN